MSVREGLAVEDALDLLDWRRRVFALYVMVRADPDPARAWRRWVEERDILFAEHPQSPLAEASRIGLQGLDYFDYDPSARVVGTVEADDGTLEQLEAGAHAPIGFRRIGRVSFTFAGNPQSAGLYWLEAYGGGLFLPFTDLTSGDETYGGGRYLLDTVKGADLGSVDDGLVLDFNFAYNPSCSYDVRWACPLAPPGNRLTVAVRAGERHRG
jgi:uncharacterized protein (DUF1684 family)